MLSFTAKDINGRDIIMPAPLSVRLDVDESAPADSLYVVFPYIDADELKSVRIFDGDKQIFIGVTDEEERLSDPSGNQLRISARSPAAYLLDNEAAPCVYDHPSSKLICERYAQPFGITVSDSVDAVYFGELNVLKGASYWSVLKNFCAACLSTLPRVSGAGVLYLGGMRREERVRFGSGAGCFRYSRLSEKLKRCEEISTVMVKTGISGGYSLPISDDSALNRGIRRVRYLNSALAETPMRCADDMIAAGRSRAYTLRLRCPGCLLGLEGCEAEVDTINTEARLYISALRYRLSDAGEYTDVILKRRKS